MATAARKPITRHGTAVNLSVIELFAKTVQVTNAIHIKLAFLINKGAISESIINKIAAIIATIKGVFEIFHIFFILYLY